MNVARSTAGDAGPNKTRWRIVVGLALLVLPATAILLLRHFSSNPYTPDCATDPLTSCFNHLSLNPTADWNEYTFVALGHVRAGLQGTSPNQVLRTNVQCMFFDDPRFVLSLGDLYVSIADRTVDESRNWMTRNIPVPFFNAVGNHDTMAPRRTLLAANRTHHRQGRALYQRSFGPLFFEFVLDSELFVFLHIQAGYDISAEQMLFLNNQIERASTDPSIRNVFFLNHLVIWSYNNPIMEPVFRYRHGVVPPGDSSFFLDEVRPMLLPLAERKEVFLLAGDIGGGERFLQTFYMRDEHFHYIATGMGNTARDSFITFSVKDGEVSMKNTNFTTGIQSPLSDFGVAHWEHFYREHPAHAEVADRIDGIDTR